MKTSLAVKSRRKPVIVKHEKREKTIRDKEGNFLKHTTFEETEDADGNIMFSVGKIEPLFGVKK